MAAAIAAALRQHRLREIPVMTSSSATRRRRWSRAHAGSTPAGADRPSRGASSSECRAAACAPVAVAAHPQHAGQITIIARNAADIADTLIERERALVFFARLLCAIEISEYRGESPARVRFTARIPYRAIAVDRGREIRARFRRGGRDACPPRRARAASATRPVASCLLCLVQRFGRVLGVASSRRSGRARPGAATSSMRGSPATSGSRRRSARVSCAWGTAFAAIWASIWLEAVVRIQGFQLRQRPPTVGRLAPLTALGLDDGFSLQALFGRQIH